MQFTGLLVATATFCLIGLFHVVVIRGEYYFSKRIWPLFLLVGVACLLASLWISAVAVSTIVAILGITCLWSIKELFEQEQRVKKGWFPSNPNRFDNK